MLVFSRKAHPPQKQSKKKAIKKSVIEFMKYNVYLSGK